MQESHTRLRLIELSIAHSDEVIVKTEDMWALLAGQNTSHAGRLAQGLQDAANLLLPADKAEVNTLRQRVDTLEVIAKAYIVHCSAACTSPESELNLTWMAFLPAG